MRRSNINYKSINPAQYSNVHHHKNDLFATFLSLDLPVVQKNRSHTGLERNEDNDRISSLFEYAQTTPKSQNNTLFLPLKTMALLERFKSKLSSAISETPSVPEEDVEELGEDDDRGW